jgi:formyltetrahydrofolate hydrolase
MKVFRNSLQSAFDEALSDVDPRFRNKEKARLVPDEDHKNLKLYMIDSSTDRALNEINIEKKTKEVENKIEDVLGDYKDLQKIVNLKLRTIGMMSNKLLKSKYKLIV